MRTGYPLVMSEKKPAPLHPSDPHDDMDVEEPREPVRPADRGEGESSDDEDRPPTEPAPR